MPLSNLITRLRVYSTLIIVLYHCSAPFLRWCWIDSMQSNELYVLLDVLFFRIISDTMLPTFFMLSGMLFYSQKEKYKNVKECFWKKFNRLIIPYCIMAVATTSLHLSKIGIGNPEGHLWFVLVLFAYFTIALAFIRLQNGVLLMGGGNPICDCLLLPKFVRRI